MAIGLLIGLCRRPFLPGLYLYFLVSVLFALLLPTCECPFACFKSTPIQSNKKMERVIACVIVKQSCVRDMQVPQCGLQFQICL